MNYNWCWITFLLAAITGCGPNVYNTNLIPGTSQRIDSFRSGQYELEYFVTSDLRSDELHEFPKLPENIDRTFEVGQWKSQLSQAEIQHIVPFLSIFQTIGDEKVGKEIRSAIESIRNSDGKFKFAFISFDSRLGSPKLSDLEETWIHIYSLNMESGTLVHLNNARR